MCGQKQLQSAMEIDQKYKERSRRCRQRQETCIKTLEHSMRLKMTNETQNPGDIELRTTKHASPYYMYSLGKVLRVRKMTSK